MVDELAQLRSLGLAALVVLGGKPLEQSAEAARRLAAHVAGLGLRFGAGRAQRRVERLVKAQRGDAMEEDNEPEPPKEEEPQQVTPEETPAEAPAPASQKPPEEDSDDDFAPKKNPWDEETPTPEATGAVLAPYILLKRDFPGRDDDLRQLGVEPTIARENKPFKLKKKPMSATTPEHVTMVPRTDGSSSLLHAPPTKRNSSPPTGAPARRRPQRLMRKRTRAATAPPPRNMRCGTSTRSASRRWPSSRTGRR